MPPSLFAIARGCLDAATPEAKVAAMQRAAALYTSANWVSFLDTDKSGKGPINTDRAKD